MPLRPFVSVPQDLRDWTRWCEEQTVGADESVETANIVDGAVTYAKIQEVAADRLLGRLSSAGVLQELTGAQVVALLQAIDWAFSGDIGFHGVAASGQQTDPGAPSVTTVSGTGDDTTINDNFVALENALNAIRAALNNKGLTG